MLSAVSHLIFTTALWRFYYDPSCTDVQTEVQRVLSNLPKAGQAELMWRTQSSNPGGLMPALHGQPPPHFVCWCSLGHSICNAGGGKLITGAWLLTWLSQVWFAYVCAKGFCFITTTHMLTAAVCFQKDEVYPEGGWEYPDFSGCESRFRCHQIGDFLGWLVKASLPLGFLHVDVKMLPQSIKRWGPGSDRQVIRVKGFFCVCWFVFFCLFVFLKTSALILHPVFGLALVTWV